MIKTVPTSPVELPKDLAAHDWARHEWWYYTGHLSAENGRRFGFELSLFRYRIEKGKSMKSKIFDTGFMGHFAVVDEATGVHTPIVVMLPGGKSAGASTDKYDVRIKSWYAGGDEKLHKVHADSKDMAITFEAVPLKPLVLHGENGIVMKSAEIGNYYVSFPRMAVTGVLRIGSEDIPVKGNAWFDHEFGYMGDIPKTGGWDWFSLRIDDNTEFMIYAVRNSEKKIETFSRACRIDENSKEECIPYSEIEVEALSRWLSPETGALYPLGWRIKMKKWNADVMVLPTVAAQEFPYGPVVYWEGSCKVSGTHKGDAFVELVGYVPKNRPQ